METQQIPKDCAIIIRNSVSPEGEQGIELQLVFTRKKEDRSEATEAEGFGQIAFNAVCKLYEQLTQPAPPRPQGIGLAMPDGTPVNKAEAQNLGGNRFGAPDPGSRFKTPTIVPGEERDLKDLRDKDKKK